MCRDSVILVLETGYVFGWLVAMVLNLIVPFESGDPMERVRAARKAKALVVPLSEEENRAIEENQIHHPKMRFESDSAHHPEPVVVPVSPCSSYVLFISFTMPALFICSLTAISITMSYPI